MGSSDNYRPIALANILSKVVEEILLSRFHIPISSTEKQFGFKINHGTDMCIFVLKENTKVKILLCLCDPEELDEVSREREV